MQALDAPYQQIVDVKPKDGNAMVMGYTDRIGSDANNQALSEARASTVANFLIGKGLPADKVSIRAMARATRSPAPSVMPSRPGLPSSTAWPRIAGSKSGSPVSAIPPEPAPAEQPAQ